MIDRENKEIKTFMDKEGIHTINEFPDQIVTPEKTFVEVKEGLYIRVVDAGEKAPSYDSKTIIFSRFNCKSISSRSDFNVVLYGPTSAGTSPLPFVFHRNSDILELAPQASVDEQNNKPLLCSALLESAKHVGNGGSVQIISSFRYAPTFLSTEGIPVFFDKVHFTFKEKKN